MFRLRRGLEAAVIEENFNHHIDDSQQLIDNTQNSTIFIQTIHYMFLFLGSLSLILIIMQITCCCYLFSRFELRRFSTRWELIIALVRMICNYRQLIETLRVAMIPHLNHSATDVSVNVGNPGDHTVSEIIEFGDPEAESIV